MNEMVKDIQKELKKRYLMGQTLKETMGLLGIDTRLLTIWKGEDDGLLQVRVKDNEEGFILSIRILDKIGTKEISNIDEELMNTAHIIEMVTEKFLELNPEAELVWDWLGD